MAEKRYFWLKLKNDFFSQKHIKKLRKVAGGDTYTIIYLKLQLLSLQDNAKIIFDETEENLIEQLSLQIDESEEDIRLTLAFLQQNKLIEINDSNDLELLETKSLIGSESASTIRSRKSRNKAKKEQKALHCNDSATNCNTDIDIELELDIELDIELEKESARAYFSNPETNKLFVEFLKTRNKQKNTIKSISALIDSTTNFTNQEIQAAIKQAIAGGYQNIFPKKKEHTPPVPEWLKEKK